MSLILGHKNRQLVRDITIRNSASQPIVAGSGDVVRIKIGRVRQVPILDLNSAAASANGSTISKNSPSSGVNRVAIVQADMNLLAPGIYTFEVSLVDGSDGHAIKHVDHQILSVQGTQLGDVG